MDWMPWGEEAFKKARRENKPVFLSIGYSTCHWCHVMAHESFEDEEIAAILNEPVSYYVCENRSCLPPMNQAEFLKHLSAGQ